MMNFFSKKGKQDKKSDKKRSDSASGSSSASSASKAVPTKPVLGVPLPVAVANNRCYDDVPLPAVMRTCIDYVEESGLDMEGIYRVSAPISRLDDLERQANLTGRIEFVDAHEAAGLLKRFLRQIPGHILLFGPYVPEDFEKIAETCKCEGDAICRCPAASELKKMLEKAPKEHYHLLAYVFQHALHVIQHEKENKMTLGALGVLLQAMFSVSRNIIKIFMMNAAPASDADPKDAAVYLFSNLPIKSTF
uniref:Rho-GAP domain-containing protein n=1 Tax=Panagrellus redivivus TaxID=6233 RepID=A0A7E4UML4_PANRE